MMTQIVIHVRGEGEEEIMIYDGGFSSHNNNKKQQPNIMAWVQ